jgi:hypothetical protein
VLAQDLPQALAPYAHPAAGVAGQVVAQLAQAPVREGTPQRRRADGGRRYDEVTVVIADQAGTASRPPRVPARPGLSR